MGTALLPSVQSPCFDPFFYWCRACSPSGGTWTICTPGVTSTGTSLALTRSSRTWRMSWRTPLRRLRIGRQSLTTERDALLGRLSDAELTELSSWTNTTAKFESTKITNRCTVLYKPTNCTGPIKLTCTKFLVDNRDPMHCKKGDWFITKPAAKNNTVEQPRIWCKREGPSENFPALSPYGNLKVWYKRSTGQLGTGRFPKKGVRCSVSC